MIRLLTLLAALVTTVDARAQPAYEDSTRAAWLAEHLVILDGGSEGADGFLRATGGARVVALGEPTHGDGTAFTLRNDLTRALHDRAGFGVLALEATGVHDLAAPFASPAQAVAAADSVTGLLWRSSAEARPGLVYAASTVGTGRPLRLAGIDVQHSPTGARSLLDAVEGALGRSGALDARWPGARHALDAAFSNPFAPIDSTTRATTIRAAADYDQALRPAEGEAALLLRTALANALVPWTRTMEPRDRQMGENAVALIDQAGAKAVVWAASSHAIRRIGAIDTLDPEWSYDGTVTAGDGIARALGGAYYVVAFTACGGAYGAAPIGLPEALIGPPEPGSLEALVCAAPFETAAFVDLRGLSATEAGGWLSAPLLARPLGYGTKRASWPVVLDGLVVVREMRPSTPYVP